MKLSYSKIAWIELYYTIWTAYLVLRYGIDGALEKVRDRRIEIQRQLKELKQRR